MLIPDEGQKLGIEFALRERYSVIPLPPGTGKTLIAVEVAKKVKGNTIVVCPSYARNVWIDEFTGQCGNTIDIYNYKSNKSIEVPPKSSKPWVVILSYSLLYDTKLENKLERTDPIFELATTVINDELHFLKSLDTGRALAFHQLIYENNPKYVIGLSGTPAKNRIHELYSPLAICAYKEDNSKFLKEFPSWIEFAEKYCYPHTVKIKTKRGGYITQVVYKGVRNIEQLRVYLRKSFFKLPSHLLAKLPERTVIEVDAEGIDKATARELSEAFRDFIDSNSKTAPKIKAQAARETAPFTAKFAKNILDKHGKVVVFTDHRESCRIIAEKLKCVAITGEMSVDKRMKFVKAFQEGEDDAIVATIGSLSTAISLTSSDVMIFNDPPWVPGDLEQAERRILRRTQKRPCTYYRIMATKQSQKIYNTLEEKQSELDQTK